MQTNTLSEYRPRDDEWRPVAYVTIQDHAARALIVNALERAGWAVIPQPTGFHLIQAIAGVIDGNLPWLRPGLIIVDARSRGCSGVTIAAGLRDLGITIPIALVVAPGERPPVCADAATRVVDAATAAGVVEALIGPRLHPQEARVPAA